MTNSTSQYLKELEQVLNETFSCSKDLAEDLQDDDNEKCRQYILEVEECVLNIAVLCNELQLVKDCASSINETCETQTELKDPDDLCEMFSTQLASAHKSNEGTFDPKSHPMYTEFIQCLEDGEKNTDLMSLSANDDDLVVDKVQKSLNCPLTKKLYDKPVTSKKCNHSFSYEAIREHIKKRSSSKCPVCNGPIIMEDLVADNVLRRMVKREKRGLASKSDSQGSRFIQL